MVRHLEAIFEDGVLRPLEPLSLPEHQHVMVTIDDQAPEASGPRPEVEVRHAYAEMAWLREHSREYIGQWVALDGDRLVAHGMNGVLVHDEAKRQGIGLPFVVRIPLDYGMPSAGWL